MKMKRLFLIPLIIMVVSGLTFTGCPAPAPAESLKIGVVGPLALFVGDHIKWGATMAAEEINAEGGILGRQIELYWGDDENRVEPGIMAMEKLIMTDKVDFIVGGSESPVILAMAHVAMENKEVFVSNAGAAMIIREGVLAEPEKFKYFFHMSPSMDSWAGAVTATVVQLAEQHGFTKVAMICDDAPWAKTNYDYMVPYYENHGLEIVYEAWPPWDAVDYTTELLAAQAAGAEIISGAVSYGIVTFVKQWYDMQIPAVLAGDYPCGPEDEAFWEMTGGKTISLIGAGVGVPRAEVTPKTMSWLEKFMERYEATPLWCTVETYDAIYMLKEVIETLGTTDSDEVAEYISEIDWVGVGARYKFDEAHHAIWEIGYWNGYGFQWVALAPEGKVITEYGGVLTGVDLILPPWME